jgi:hypothetical protein
MDGGALDELYCGAACCWSAPRPCWKNGRLVGCWNCWNGDLKVVGVQFLFRMSLRSILVRVLSMALSFSPVYVFGRGAHRMSSSISFAIPWMK